MKFTPEINPKKSMVASSTVGFEIHSDMNTFSTDMVKNVLEGDDKDLQGHIVCVHYNTENDETDSENETDLKDNVNDGKCVPVKKKVQKPVDNNLIEKLADLNINVNVYNDGKEESVSLKEDLKIKNENSEENYMPESSVTEKIEPKDDDNDDDDKNNNKDKIEDNTNKEEDLEKCNLKQPKVGMNISFDEVVEGIDKIKLTTKSKEEEEEDEEKDEVTSRGPSKGHQTLGNIRTTLNPYPSFTSHNLQAGGCVIAQVPAGLNYDLKSGDIGLLLERSESPLSEKDELSDEAERKLLDSMVNSFIGNEWKEAEIQQKPVNEQQVPFVDLFTKDLVVNNALWAFETTDERSKMSSFQCLSPASNDDLLEATLFSPPPYGSYAASTSTRTPSPLSTDSSSICFSPRSNSLDYCDENSESVFGLNFPSIPVCTDSQISYPSVNNVTESLVKPNKFMTNYQPTNFQPQAPLIETKRTANINNTVAPPKNYISGNTFNPPLIRQEPEVRMTESRSAFERMNLDQEKIRTAFRDLALLKDEKLSAADKDGDTNLLIMIAQKLPKGHEYFYAFVSRLTKIPGALAARNFQKHSALLLACMYMPDQPLVARFIAETLQSIKHDLNEVYDDGNTIIHWLCERGDAYLNVLVELLSMRDSTGSPSFNINKHNYTTGTPLHVAVKVHQQNDVNCSGTVAFLLSQGADVTEKERYGGRTSLHLAIQESGDPLLVQMLLKAADRQGKDLVNCLDYPRDTALHYAHLRNKIPIQQQLRIITLLLQFGATNINGSQGRMPLALVTSAERKEIIRANTQRRNRKH